MDRTTWLKAQRRLMEEQDDALYAPIYDEQWGGIEPFHEQFITRFLGLCPPGGHTLDAPCGTGKYWPMILGSGRTVLGIDQSGGMLARARQKHPDVPCVKGGLQEMDYRQAFDGGICVDALEMVPPEEWLLVLRNFHRALRPQSYLYLTVEITSEAEIARAFTDAQREGLPVVYGEWAYESGYQGDWAQDGGYHFYPGIDQVKTWLQEAGYRLIEEDVADEYHHFLVRRAS